MVMKYKVDTLLFEIIRNVSDVYCVRSIKRSFELMILFFDIFKTSDLFPPVSFSTDFAGFKSKYDYMHFT